MKTAQEPEPTPGTWQHPDSELVCLLCGATVGQTYGSRVAHHANCARALPWLGGRPRCCRCGGPLISEPTAGIWGPGP